MSPDTSKGICVCAECKECKLGALTEFCLEQCARGTRVSVSPGDAEHGPGPNGGNEMSQRASLQMPLGLWHASWLRTTAVFTDEVHLYKYSVFLPDKNNYCPYWSI